MRPERKRIYGLWGFLWQQNWYWREYKWLSGTLRIFESEIRKILCRFFVLKAANLSEENEKLARTMCATRNYTTMKETYRHRNKNIPVKEKVETINFNCYMSTKKNQIEEEEEMEKISRINEVSRNAILNVILFSGKMKMLLFLARKSSNVRVCVYVELFPR